MRAWMYQRRERTEVELGGGAEDQYDCFACEFANEHVNASAWGVSFIENELGQLRRVETLVPGKLRVFDCREVTREQADLEIGQEGNN